MPDFRCVACRTRIRHAGDVAADTCPECGSPLDLVDDLAEVVGFRSVKPTGDPVDIAAPVADFTGRRNAIYAQRVRDALDAERWLDDGGFAVAAVALPTSNRNAGTPGENGTT
jgi:transposase